MAVVALTPGGGAFTEGLAASLRARDAQVRVGPVRNAGDIADADAVVHVCGDGRALTAGALDGTAPDDWDARCESVLREGLTTLQAAHDAFGRRGRGRVVVVTATAGLSGAASLVPYVTAAEGVRAMAKSAARQWGTSGITVNTVLVPVGLLEPAAAPHTSFLTPPALGAPAGLDDVAAAVHWFACHDSAGITGAAIVVDGGAVMAP